MFVTIPNILNHLVLKQKQAARFQIPIIYYPFILPWRCPQKQTNNQKWETFANEMVFDDSGPTFPISCVQLWMWKSDRYRSLRRIVQGWELLQHFTHKLCAFFSLYACSILWEIYRCFSRMEIWHIFFPLFLSFPHFWLSPYLCTSCKVHTRSVTNSNNTKSSCLIELKFCECSQNVQS